MGRVRNCGYEEDQRTLDGGVVFLFFIVTNRSVVFYYSKVKSVAPRDALLGYNNNYLRSKNDVDLSPVEGLFRPSTLGFVDYVQHTGSNPMSIIWRLEDEIPAKYLRQTSKLIVS